MRRSNDGDESVWSTLSNAELEKYERHLAEREAIRLLRPPCENCGAPHGDCDGECYE